MDEKRFRSRRDVRPARVDGLDVKLLRPLMSRDTMSFPRLHSERKKIRATVYVSAEILDAARNAVAQLAGNPARLTLTKLVETALAAELRRLKDLYHQGQDFPPRAEELKGGRPIAA